MTQPTREWGPALVKHRKLVDYVDGFVVDPWETGTKKEEKQGMENWGMIYSISTQDMKVFFLRRLCVLLNPFVSSSWVYILIDRTASWQHFHYTGHTCVQIHVVI